MTPVMKRVNQDTVELGLCVTSVKQHRCTSVSDVRRVYHYYIICILSL